jgi:hypothetical protein
MKRKALVFCFGTFFAGILLISGCAAQNTDRDAKSKLTNAIVNDVTNGKVNVDLNNQNITVKTPQGDVKISGNQNNMTVNSPDGNINYQGGSGRPSSVPEDLPNMDNAKEFSWVASKDGGMFSYILNGTAYQEMCQKQVELLTAKAWQLDKSFIIDVENSSTRSLKKEGFQLNLNCSLTSGGDDTTTIVMIKSKVQ